MATHNAICVQALDLTVAKGQGRWRTNSKVRLRLDLSFPLENLSNHIFCLFHNGAMSPV